MPFRVGTSRVAKNSLCTQFLSSFKEALNRLVCMQASEKASEEASGKREMGFSKEQLQKKKRADDDDDDEG